jgi:hypothetical protein
MLRNPKLAGLETVSTMAEQEIDFTPDPMRRLKFVSELCQGIGIASGLGLLWIMETVRDGVFGLLDRVNLKPRPRRASAFPPGRPRRSATRQARP